MNEKIFYIFLCMLIINDADCAKWMNLYRTRLSCPPLVENDPGFNRKKWSYICVVLVFMGTKWML